MSSSNQLAARQQWLLESILQGPQASQMASEFIVGSAQMSAAARLAIYQDGYRLRLLECMAAEFPALQHYLGEPLFRLFSLGYLQQQPSRHYSLYQLGEGFADFLAATRPSEKSVQPQWAAGLKIPEQLARFERARANALRAAGAQPHSTPELGCLFHFPALALPQSSTLVEHDFALHDYVLAADRHALALEQGQSVEKPAMPAVQPESLLVYRHQFRVKVVKLEAWQADVLRVFSATTHRAQKGKAMQADWQTLLEHNRLAESELLMKLNPKDIANVPPEQLESEFQRVLKMREIAEKERTYQTLLTKLKDETNYAKAKQEVEQAGLTPAQQRSILRQIRDNQYNAATPDFIKEIPEKVSQGLSDLADGLKPIQPQTLRNIPRPF